jgi:hypothetical protein
MPQTVHSQSLISGSVLPADFLAIGTDLRAKESRTPLVPDALTQALLSKENPFWQTGRVQAFWISEQARALAFYQSGHDFAFFGYWNSVDSEGVTHRLFSEIENWARAQGAHQVIGPLNFKTAYDYRLRLDDFDEPAFWGEPTNPEFYVRLLKHQGFRIQQLYHTDFIDNLAEVKKLSDQKLGRALRGSDPLRVQNFSPELFEQEKTVILNLANLLFQENAAFQKVETFDFQLLYNPQTLAQADRKNSFLIYDEKNQVRGLCFSFAHPYDSGCLLVKSIGIDPAYRQSGRTFVAALKRIFDYSTSYQKIAFCLMTEDNQAHRVTSQYLTRRRSYGLFQKKI